MAERISQIRVTTGNHPVSSAVRRKADALDQFVMDLTAAEQNGQAVNPGKLATALRMLVGDLRGFVAPAVQDLEDLARSQMGACK